MHLVAILSQGLDEMHLDELGVMKLITIFKLSNYHICCKKVLKKNKMIKLTDNALLHLRSLRKEHDKKFVRLQVKGGGCAGFEYEWSFADEETRNDVIVDDILLIDRINELYLMGLELDYKNDDLGN